MANGVELATAWVRLTFSADGLQESVTDEVDKSTRDLDKKGESAGSRFSSGMKTALVAGAAVAVAGLVKVFNTGLDELKFGEEINAQTDLLIQNTGFTGTTKEINDLTLALSELSGISEEDLQQAGNNVLKFGDVSEDTYTRAVESINDMGGAGKDVVGISEALGKALADPAAAAALLKRQGVLLNDEQKALIDNFTAVGDKAGAQGVILDALEGTYGGMAEAAGGTLQGNINKLNNAFENLSGDLVTLVMPAVEGIVAGLQGLVGWFSDNQELIPIFAVAIGVLALAFVGLTVATWAMNTALLANPITWIVLAVIALIAAIVLLIMNWDTVVKFLGDTWAGFVGWITGVMEGFAGWWGGVWNGMIGFVTDVWTGFVNWFMGGFNAFFAGIIGIGDAIKEWWNGLWAGLAGFVGDAFSNVGNFIVGILNTVIDLVNGALSGINDMGALASSITGGVVGWEVGLLPNLPGLQNGGKVLRAGSVLVGEVGPEILHLPAGAQVEPLGRSGSGGGDTFIQNNDFAHQPPEIAVDMAGQRMTSMARRARV